MHTPSSADHDADDDARPLDADRAEIAAFTTAMFVHADDETYVSLRTFSHNAADPPVDIKSVRLNGAGFAQLNQVAFGRASYAARHPVPTVFAPPIATFTNATRAREVDLACGLVLSVEIDSDANAGLALLRGLLGLPTVVVASGGIWTDPATGEVQPKLHAHWRLCEPTRDAEEHGKLKLARRLATALIGGDHTNIPVVHPLRWPGSLHRKGTPKLCRTVELNDTAEIDLEDALDALEAAAIARGINIDGNGPSGSAGDPRDTAALIAEIMSARAYVAPLVALSARFAGGGMTETKIIETLQGFMLAVPSEIRDGGQPGRWQARFDSIPRMAASAVEKFGPDAAATEHGHKLAEELLAGFQAKAEAEQNKTDEQKAEEQKAEAHKKAVGVLGFDLFDWNARVVFAGEAPPQEWLVSRTIPRGVAGIIASTGDLGKSYLCLELGLRASGGPLTGTAIQMPILGGSVTAHGAVVILTSEDGADSIHRRMRALDPDEKRPAKYPLIVVPLIAAGGTFPIVEQRRGGQIVLTQKFYALRDQLRAIPDRVLIVFDPLQCFVYADINADPQVAAFMMAALNMLASDLYTTILANYHVRKSEQAPKDAEQARAMIRGSSALVDQSRVAVVLWPPDEPDARKACRLLGAKYEPRCIVRGAVVKSNDGANRSMWTLLRDPVTGMPHDVTGALKAKGGNLEELLDALVSAIAAAAEAGRPFTHLGVNGLYVRRAELGGEPLASMARDRLEKMAEELLDVGRIVKALAGGTTVQWLDAPDGKFASGEGAFASGASRGKAGRKEKSADTSEPDAD